MASIAIVLVAGLPAQSWALLGFDGVTFDGSLEVSAVRGANEDDRKDGFGDGVNGNSDRHSDVDTRTRLGINMQVTEGVDGRVEFVRTGQRYGNGTETLHDEQNNIVIQNAFINMMLWNWAMRLGRQYVGEEGDLVWNIGPRSDDILRVQSVDGVDFRRSWEGLWVNLFLGKFDDNNAQGGTADIDEVSLKTLMLGYALQDTMNLWAGIVSGSNSRTGATSDSTKLMIYRAGLRGSLAENFITYRGEVLANKGEDKSGVPAGGQKLKYKGRALDVGAGLNLPESGAGQFSFGGNFLWASGDDNQDDNDDESFRDLSAVGAESTDRYYGEIFGRSNALSLMPLGMGIDSGAQGTGLTILHANVLYKPSWAPKSWWRLDWYDFSSTEDSQTVAGVNTKRGDFGSEIDLTAGYRYSDNVGFEAGYAMLDPDDRLETTLNDGTRGDDNVTKWFARMKVAFGEAPTAP